MFIFPSHLQVEIGAPKIAIFWDIMFKNGEVNSYACNFDFTTTSVLLEFF